MPIYEYKCANCGELIEFTMKMSDPHPETCPNCGADQSLVKQMSQTAFQLKGGGWYAHGYDGKSNQKKSTSGSESKSVSTDTPKKSPAKSES